MVSQDHEPTITAVTSGQPVAPLPRFAMESADFNRGRVVLKGKLPVRDGRDLQRLLNLLDAAPDLLEALKLARKHIAACKCSPSSGCTAAADRVVVDAAISKATGE